MSVTNIFTTCKSKRDYQRSAESCNKTTGDRKGLGLRPRHYSRRPNSTYRPRYLHQSLEERWSLTGAHGSGDGSGNAYSLGHEVRRTRFLFWCSGHRNNSDAMRQPPRRLWLCQGGLRGGAHTRTSRRRTSVSEAVGLCH